MHFAIKLSRIFIPKQEITFFFTSSVFFSIFFNTLFRDISRKIVFLKTVSRGFRSVSKLKASNVGRLERPDYFRIFAIVGESKEADQRAIILE